ncbi:hypothetical protein GOP47_0001920 [Adiantum capillus-veneris]|uniref:Kinesin motor domain-containing protein n=1 Tax=Adiantum capillus-veneris TaxID=13818 RepID=A0A9D4ZQL4_ADICA|nr:hypothetical protein GOP47_0001920 [Adiantum capillus-veneris]
MLRHSTSASAHALITLFCVLRPESSGLRLARTPAKSLPLQGVQSIAASKHRQVSLINRLVTPSPCAGQSPFPSDHHPVEVVARIRDHPEGADNPSVLQVTQNGQTVRIRTEQGYRDFGLDGVSLAENEALPSFYKKYVESRIESVKAGGRCTIMMYGPTGAGKSHTMFGSAKEPGIAYRALQNILGGSNGSLVKMDDNGGIGSPDYSTKKTRVIVTILEIYNEEIFDLLAASNIPSGQWIRPNLARVRLEIMGKKAKNAVSITGTDADKISKEIAKVEKRRVVKSTLCNERSSRSHCLVMLDVPALGGRLVLVDMAGSENLEQAGMGTDAKLQTGKINQGNIALKRVVEAIANGDSYIPFRDSKLTMLLQDSFEDDESKILMILCASPDPKDIYKTIGTLEYGCKAKCIVSLPASPAKDKINGVDRVYPSILEARVQAMDVHISKLEAENQSKEKEKEEIYKELKQKEQDLAALQQVLEAKKKCSMCCNDELGVEMEGRIKECQRVAEEFVAMEKKKLEEKVADQQREIDCMRSRMKEIEREVELFLTSVPTFSQVLSKLKSDDGDIVCKVRGVLERINMANKESQNNQVGCSALQINSLTVHGSCESTEANGKAGAFAMPRDNDMQEASNIDNTSTSKDGITCNEDIYANGQAFYEQNGWLPIIPEEESEEEMMADGEEIQELPLEKAGEFVLQTMENGVYSTRVIDNNASQHQVNMDMEEGRLEGDVNNRPSDNSVGVPMQTTPSSYRRAANIRKEPEGGHAPVSAASRRSRIENIFLLCGNHRELAAVTNIQGHSYESHCSATHVSDQASCVNHQLVSQSADTGEQACVALAASAPVTVMTSPITPKKASAKKSAKGSDNSPARFLSVKSRHPFSENTPPHGMMLSYSSPSSALSTPQYSKSPAMPSVVDSAASASNVDDEKNSSAALTNSDFCDVYVKWETSKESSGKVITILKLNRNTTLADLRKELENQQAELTNDFTFLMLGDPSGNPVEREAESCLCLSSLPDCHKQRGTKLACLRPHVNKLTTNAQGPLGSVENQMTWNSPKQVARSFQKAPLVGFPLRPTNEADRLHEKANQRLSFPLISQIKGIRF